MYMIYQPEGTEEPKRWKLQPKKIMSAEREAAERVTGLDWGEITIKVQKGNSKCRRALLWIYLKRDHHELKFADVDFAWDELRFEYSKAELREMRDRVAEVATGDEGAAALAGLDRQIEEAFEDPEDEGKAELPIAD